MVARKRKRDPNVFGHLISQYLVRKGISERAFSKAIKIPFQTFNHLRHQPPLKTRSLEEVKRWGAVLGLSENEIKELHLALALARCPAVVQAEMARLRDPK